jgi:hypothetical protein
MVPWRHLGRSCWLWWCLAHVSVAWAPSPPLPRRRRRRRHFVGGGRRFTHGLIVGTATAVVRFHPQDTCGVTTTATQETKLHHHQSRQQASVVVERGDGGDTSGNNGNVVVPSLPRLPQLPSSQYPSFSMGRMAILVMIWSSLLAAAAPFWTISGQQPPLFVTASAAPPIAIIAEELGYFPVTTQSDSTDSTTRTSTPSTIYVPARVKRASTQQAVALADYLQTHNVRMAGTFWCPHCRRQKEVFGAEAWSRIEYVECAPLGYRGNPAQCLELGVTAYPMWIVPTTPSSAAVVEPSNDESLTDAKILDDSTTAAAPSFRLLSGERSLADLAAAVGFPGPPIDASLEEINAPPLIGNSACPQ